MLRHRLLTTTLCVSLLSGCETMGNIDAGSALSCVGGGLLTAGVTKWLGGSDALAVGTGVAGCVAGWAIFKELTKNDQKKLQERTAELAAKDTPQQNVRWTAPESGTKVNLSSAPARSEEKVVSFAVDKSVQTPQTGVRIEGKTYIVVARRLHFRSSPNAGTTDNIIGFFDRGENVEVVGITPDGRWALVGDNNVVVGYAALREGTTELLLSPTEARARRLAVASAARARPKLTRVASNGTPTTTPVVRDREIAQVRVEKVKASTECKAVTAQTGQQSKTLDHCVAPNGQWAIA